MLHNSNIKTSINQQLFDENSHLSLNRQLSEQLINCELETNFIVQKENTEENQVEKPIAIVGGIERCHQNNNKILLEEDDQQLLSSFVRAISIIPQNNNIEWTALRKFRVQEINEIRQRAAHMENTMRWWLLSAEGWRQKWFSVRNERNRLKEENIRLKKELIEIKMNKKLF